jgi:hypothetical protein
MIGRVVGPTLWLQVNAVIQHNSACLVSESTSGVFRRLIIKAATLAADSAREVLASVLPVIGDIIPKDRAGQAVAGSSPQENENKCKKVGLMQGLMTG